MNYEEVISENKKWIDDTFNKINKKFEKVAVRSRYKLPFSTVNGVHNDFSNDITWWTNGFFGGLMWLLFESTGNNEYMLSAKESEKMLGKAFKEIDELHHDVGFMYHLTSGASYRLTGNKESRNTNLLAALMLAGRYNLEGEFIRAWNIEGSEGWTIIDSMMNLALLYWASDETKDDRFKYIALKQADMSLKDHIRSDYTVNHIVMHDTKSNKVLGTKGGQGYKEGSCWSRGEAWALYGFILSYIHSSKEEYLNVAKGVADLFIKKVEVTSWLPRTDFDQPDEPKSYDSSAGAIASAGLIEVAKATGNAKYLNAAINILKGMEIWCDFDESTDGLLNMGMEQYHGAKPRNLIYGDFFYVEAVLKLRGSKFLIW